LKKRKHVRSVETEVLKGSGRRCCLCFGLYRDLGVKSGQIAHLDQNPANNRVDNLAFLCLEHHDQYDTPTSQSKGWTILEVKSYRAELHKAVEAFRSMESENVPSKAITKLEQFFNEQSLLFEGITSKVDQLTNEWQEFKKNALSKD
jgi:hypothetical protein